MVNKELQPIIISVLIITIAHRANGICCTYTRLWILYPTLNLKIYLIFSYLKSYTVFGISYIPWRTTLKISESVGICPWREYHRCMYYRTTLSIMSPGWRSAIQYNWLRWSNWERTADLILPCVCSPTKMLKKIKHPYQLHPYERSGDCPESNQLHFIIM